MQVKGEKFEALSNYAICMFNCVHRQSQVGKLGREAMSPQELASFQDSISSMAASQKDKVGDVSLDADALLQLLSQQVDESSAETSQGIIVLLPWFLLRNNKLLLFMHYRCMMTIDKVRSIITGILP